MDLNIAELRLAARRYRSKSPKTVERLLALIELVKRVESKGQLCTLDVERVAADRGVTATRLTKIPSILREEPKKYDRGKNTTDWQCGLKRRFSHLIPLLFLNAFAIH